jgi:WD40 repeat protein
MTILNRIFPSLASLTLFIACESPRSGAESALAPNVGGIQAMSFANSEWSEPVNLGATINSAANEQTPTLSSDGLSLYFSSGRAGGFGGSDIWVSRRPCQDCDWDAPVNLGPVINSAATEFRPSLSTDGHLLFLQSNRPGGHGGSDIWVSHRTGSTEDLDWEQPVNLGPGVNTAGDEQVASYLQGAGGGTLYFARGSATLSQQDIYVADVTRNGETSEPAVFVAELSDPTVNDAGPTVRTDGREIVFHSGRLGGVGLADLWTSTRQSVNHHWSPPMNLTTLNSTEADLRASLSDDGRSLLFDSTRPGGFGGADIWMSTRTPSGKEAP